MDSREFSARLTIFSKRKSGYTALRLTVVECDEDGQSYHFAIILNDRLDRRSTLERFMAQLFTGGVLVSYKVVCPDIDAFGHHLRTLEEKDSYFEWMTYLVKVVTKADTGQVWSSYRALANTLKGWRLAGMPDLREQLFCFDQADKNATADILGLT